MSETGRVNAAKAVVAALLTAAAMRSTATTELCEDRSNDNRRVSRSNESHCLLLGGGVLGGDSEFLSDNLSTVFPVVYLGYGPFYWDTTEIGFYVLGTQQADRYRRAAILLEFPDDGFKVETEEHLAGLSDRDPTSEGGVKYEAGGQWGKLMVGANIDLDGEHAGVRAYSRYAFPVELGSFVVSPKVSATYRDEKNNDYNYGETEDERPDHVAYKADEETLTPGLATR